MTPMKIPTPCAIAAGPADPRERETPGQGVRRTGNQPYLYLTRRESSLLDLLERSAGRPVGNDEIVTELFADRHPDKNTLAVYIHNLRKKIRMRPDIRIDTVLNQGYVLRHIDTTLG